MKTTNTVIQDCLPTIVVRSDADYEQQSYIFMEAMLSGQQA
jgi:hypothetical protein